MYDYTAWAMPSPESPLTFVPHRRPNVQGEPVLRREALELLGGNFRLKAEVQRWMRMGRQAEWIGSVRGLWAPV